MIHKWDIKIVHVSSVIMAEKEKNELNAEESVLNYCMEVKHAGNKTKEKKKIKTNTIRQPKGSFTKET